MPTIYYIRHGETGWNAQGRLQGVQDVPLNNLGRRQSVHAGHILADLLARDGRDARSLKFVCSPLGRARESMELLRVAPPGGENYVSVQARMRDWHSGLEDDTVAVAHGGTARALMVALGFLTPDRAADLTIGQGCVYVFRDSELSHYYS